MREPKPEWMLQMERVRDEIYKQVAEIDIDIDKLKKIESRYPDGATQQIKQEG